MGFFDRIKNVFSSEDKLKYETSLRKSNSNLGNKLAELSKKSGVITKDYFEELEEILIMADVGVNTVFKLIELLEKRCVEENITSPEILNEIIVDELLLTYVSGEAISTKIDFNHDLTVILVVGVNGVGKTTTIGKLASKFTKEGKKVCLAAGDTFRAGATKQLELWGEQIGCPVVSGKDQSDPASVIYEAIAYCKEHSLDVLICDTAGRLQNKTNLMNELEKINRIIGREVENAPHETLLVLDGTTGQNGISQASAFMTSTNVSGIVLTKMDGASKGGIVLAIKEELKLPVKFIGLGEKVDDLDEFDIEKYMYGLFAQLDN